MERVFWIVLDSFGIGELPDAADYGDKGSHTLRSLLSSPLLDIPVLRELGLFNVEGIACGRPVKSPTAAVGRFAERSCGKDSTTGHWEMAGVILNSPFPTYPDGFPDEIIKPFEAATGRGTLCNRSYSGTQVIDDYGQAHIDTGKLIVYTSSDSVFQIAAHEDVVPPETLYEYCRIARRLLREPHAVGRVIARPFIGEAPHFERTPRRHDFSLAPPRPTVLDALHRAKIDTIAVGKINDLFAGRGISRAISTTDNADGMAKTLALAGEDFHGLCYLNLVDFDTVYGHRNDIDGYAAALTRFDRWLTAFLPQMRRDDVLFITADHGCDPGAPGTDHSREYVPLLVYGERVRPVNLGTRNTFADIGATVAALFGVTADIAGTDFAKEIGL